MTHEAPSCRVTSTALMARNLRREKSPGMILLSGLGKGDIINGIGSVTASVTLYGPDGADDITYLTGYTMTSDANEFFPIAEGIYDCNYMDPGKGGKLLGVIVNWLNVIVSLTICSSLDIKENEKVTCLFVILLPNP